MKNRNYGLIFTIAALILCTACNTSTKVDDTAGTGISETKESAATGTLETGDIENSGSSAADKPAAAGTSESEEPANSNTSETEEAAAKTQEDAAEPEIALFADMSRYSYSFSSGVGGWGTELSINPDGSFTGSYSDSDMGSTGEGYPNGTLYCCEFSGRFAEPISVDEYTYTTEIEELNYSEEPGKEEIADDGILYVSSTAYGLEEAKTIYIYKPGKPYSELPEGYVWWVNAPTGGTIEDDRNGEMEAYGIYNENADCGFISYQNDFNRDDILRIYERDQEKHKENDARFYNEPLDQFSMNMLTYEEFSMWDDLLNDLWSYLKKTFDEDTMQALTEEQREWIKEKEETVSRESAGFEGGSMQPQIKNGVAARITRERVEYLVREYVK